MATSRSAKRTLHHRKTHISSEQGQQVETLEPRRLLAAAPVVLDVQVADVPWSAAFTDYLRTSGQGEQGYSLLKSGKQLETLPWINIEKIVTRFSENVTGTTHAALLQGVNYPLAEQFVGNEWDSEAFRTEPRLLANGYFFDATNLSQSSSARIKYPGGIVVPLKADKVLLHLRNSVRSSATGMTLDGEWTDGSGAKQSGDGNEGGVFAFRFNVLPGDANGDGRVDLRDVVAIRNRASAIGSPLYAARYDLNGDGVINGVDVNAATDRVGSVLPVGEPARPALPATPTGVSVTAGSESLARVSWNPAGYGFLSGMEIQRSDDGGNSFYTARNVMARRGFYEDALPTDTGNTRIYRLRAYDAVGLSGWSSPVTTSMLATPAGLPPAPGRLSGSIVNQSLTLNWFDRSNNETKFVIERSLDGVSGWSNGVEPSANTTSQTQSVNRYYHYRVRSANGAGVSAPSNVLAPTYRPESSTVGLTVQVQDDPATIRLSWKTSLDSVGYQVYRKTLTAASWGQPIAELPADATQFVDTNVQSGVAYEYRVIRPNKNPSSSDMYPMEASRASKGFAYAGIGVPMTEQRGTLVLVVDETQATPLASEIQRLTMDLIGDGWRVVQRNVARTATVPQVKATIKAVYDADPVNVKAVLLLGHIAVPYSGLNNYDDHADHRGAWPADVYYADMDGIWRDQSVNTGTGRNVNVPGDGKFDHNDLIGDNRAPELMLGRVDMADLPSFSLSETELLRRYLDKDHAFRTKAVDPARRALLRDDFGNQTNAAYVGWGNFPVLVGADNIHVGGSYLTTLRSQSYLWTYAAGGGTYTGNTLVNTSDFASGPFYGVFNMLFGSYFGDWDNSNNLLRAAIAGDGHSLTSVWGARPNWQFHPMALGETIGLATMVTQHDPGTIYDYGGIDEGLRANQTLLGDPSLRMVMVAPVTGLTRSQNSGGTTLAWQAPADSNIVGYHIYRAATLDGVFTRLNATPLTGTTFTDATGNGTEVYMVRPSNWSSPPAAATTT